MMQFSRRITALVMFGAAIMSTPLGAQSGAPTQSAVFAAGCFWCVESDFEKVPGVVEVISGYSGGRTPKPTYETASADGHIEVVKVIYDPSKVSYAQLLDFYWRHVDLVDGDGQFCDRGNTYRPAIFVDGPEQERAAEASKSALTASKRFSKPIAVTIEKAAPFVPAEDYHQDYYKKNSIKYKLYRYGCGRDARLEALWGKDAAAGH